MLKQRLRLDRIKKYGVASETLSAQQLELLEWEPGVSSDEVQAESEWEPLADSPSPPRKKRRHPALEISRARLHGWVTRMGESLIPLAATTPRELLRGHDVQADQTPLDVQMQDGRGKNHPAYLWQYDRAEARRAEAVFGAV